MRRFLIVAAVLGCGMLAYTSSARKTYTLEEIESMKKSGALTGSERFVMVGAEEAGGIIPGKSESPSLTPQTSRSASLSPSTNQVLAFDEIGTNRYLITMAREYYGNPDLWPYIYQANDFGHPDRIKPGTTVVIPNLKKSGINPQNPADVEKAKRLAKDIYARFGKDI